VGNHIRGHVVGYVALFVALSGVAYADDGPLAGQNTVGSADIINAEVYSQDIQPDAVGSGKVADNSLTAADLAAQSVRFGELASSAFYAPDIAPLPRGIPSHGIPINAIQGSEIQSDTIGRSDLAASAEAPAGFSFSDNDTGIICNGGCTEGTLHVPSGTFAVFGKIRVRQSDSDAEWLSVQCDLTTNGVSDHSESVIEGEARVPGDADRNGDAVDAGRQDLQPGRSDIDRLPRPRRRGCRREQPEDHGDQAGHAELGPPTSI
jgi:hypothetical protein